MKLALLLLLVPGAVWAAPPGARVDGEAIVVKLDGREIRLPHPGLKRAALALIPLRSDGSQPALWASVVGAAGMTGELYSLDDPPKLLLSMSQTSTRRGISSTSRNLWMLDLDGDGWNDLIQYSTVHSDVGRQDESPEVLRQEPASGRFVPAGRALAKKAPRALPGRDRQLDKLLPGERWFVLDPRQLPLTPPLDDLSGAGLPFVGPDLLELRVDKKGEKLYLALLRAFPKRARVTLLDLGTITFPKSGCKGRRDELRREGDQIVVTWLRDGRSVVRQNVPWDGQALGTPKGPPVVLEICTGGL